MFKVRLGRMFKSSLFFCILLILFFLIFSGDSKFDKFENVYEIEKVIDEVSALETIRNGEVLSAIEKDDFIFFNVDNVYYRTNYSKNVDMALQMSDAEYIKDSSTLFGLPFSVGLGVLFMLAIIVFIIGEYTFKIYRERKIIDTAKEMAYTSLGNSNISEYMSGVTEENKDSVKSEEHISTINNVSFNDVQGIDELKPDLYRLVDCLKNPNKYEEMGARLPKGVALYGPPGTGKTLTAKAIAGEAGVPFFSICGSDFVEKYVGVGASRVRSLYKQARKVAPCIVFIDEIDAIGGSRGNENNSEKDQTINALLAELDGFNGMSNILTICATNRLDILDPALLRAGRFDLKLAISLPDRNGREQILKVHMKNKKFSSGVNVNDLASKTVGFSGAELENLLNESALIAANSNKNVIDKGDIEDAFFKILLEGNKKPRKEIDEDAILTAWHEAGHTLATKLLTNDSVPTVTIIQSTSGAGGVTFMAPDEKNLPSKKYLRNKIKIDYAGRAAEEIYLGNSDDITTGASADIKQATSVIKSYIGAYGMGNKGLIDIKQLTNQYDIVDEAMNLSTTLYAETLDLLRNNKDKLEKIANALLENETLYESDIDSLLGISIENENS